ncbi:MAG: carboxylate--amine ligase, partial [Candidatus Peregrinibacteria bacterium]|nr:carboxylate--amine ligase [Candidatus Peregrinibacteria bacterium]
VLYRVPANVMGDGEHTIQELVDLKNDTPWRGEGYKTPLERIELSEIELRELRAQGLTVNSIPEENEIIFLRKNSNISTGGDSIDYTDKVHEGYKQVAIDAAKAVDATLCGVDIILSDIGTPPSPKNHSIIEVNFNPVLYFHDYPFQGENRHTAQYVLDALGF